MDQRSIFSKTARGLQEATGKTSILPRDLRNVLREIDGKATVEQLVQRTGTPEQKLTAALVRLAAEGFAREMVVGVQFGATPLRGPQGEIQDDLDFTSIVRTKPPAGRGEGPARQNAQADESARAAAATRAREEMSALKKVIGDATAASARAREEAEAKSKAEAAARVRAEMDIKAKLEAEARAKAEAEARARAEEAEVRAKKEAEELRGRLEAERRAREETERIAKLEAEQLARAVEERARKQAEEHARREAEERARIEADLRARLEAERKAREDAEARAKAEAEAREQQEAAEQARRQAEESARLRAEQRARRQEEEKARYEAELARKEAEALRLNLEAERRAREEAEARAQAEAEARSRQEAEEREHRQAEENARLEAEERARREAEERARIEAERARQEAEELRVRLEAERRAREEAEQRAQAEAEARLQQQEAEERERRQAEENARLEAEEVARREAEERARREAEETLQRENEERERREAEEIARREAEERARREAEETLQRENEERERREAEEVARREDEERKARKEAARAAKQAKKQAAREERERAKAEAEAAAIARKEARARKRAEQDEQELVAVAASAPPGGPYVAAHVLHAQRQRNLGRPIALGLFLVLLAAIIAIHFIGLDPVPFEKAAENRFGQPVKIGSINISLVPLPHVRIEQVTIGTAPRVRIAAIKVIPEFDSLFDQRKVFKSVEFDGAVLPQEFVGAALWGRGQGDMLRIDRVVARGIKLEFAGFALPPLHVDAAIGPEGLTKITFADTDSKLSGTLQLKGDEAQIEFSAKPLSVPFAPEIELEDFSGKGAITRGELVLNEFEAKLFDGILRGGAKLRWLEGWSFDGQLAAQQMDAAKAAAPLLGSGRLGGKGSYTMKAASADKLLASARIEGNVTVQRGALAKVDLTRVLQGSPSAGGTTLFSELGASLVGEGGRLQVRQLRLAAGLLSGSGALDIDAQKNLSGRMQIELRSQATQARATLAISGTLKDPQLRRSN